MSSCLHICLIKLLQSNRTGTANPSACLSYLSHIWFVSAPLSKTLQTQRSTRQLVLALHSRFWSRIQDSNQQGSTKSQQNERTTEPNGHFRIPRPPVILSCWLLDIVNLEVGFTKNISNHSLKVQELCHRVLPGSTKALCAFHWVPEDLSSNYI